MTRHNLFHAMQTAITSRLLLIIIALMIASLFSVLPIKGCPTTGRQRADTTEISALPHADQSSGVSVRLRERRG
ncbi:hypothetical protein ILFOPFJJ_05752 [Ensifer psoraleae]|nr:hypothetical protein [Sinorhizobium psoraleae]